MVTIELDKTEAAKLKKVLIDRICKKGSLGGLSLINPCKFEKMSLIKLIKYYVEKEAKNGKDKSV
jgi:hypothetical protein